MGEGNWALAQTEWAKVPPPHPQPCTLHRGILHRTPTTCTPHSTPKAQHPTLKFSTPTPYNLNPEPKFLTPCLCTLIYFKPENVGVVGGGNDALGDEPLPHVFGKWSGPCAYPTPFSEVTF